MQNAGVSNLLSDAVAAVRVVRRGANGAAHGDDALAAEEPLEIRLQDGPRRAPRRLLVTMRTPGHDEDLTVGLLYGEGLIDRAGDVAALAPPPEARIDPDIARNVLVARLHPRQRGSRRIPARFGVTTSACGVCGRRSIAGVLALAAGRSSAPVDHPVVPASILPALPAALGGAQAVFSATGGLHAAGLFDGEGRLLLAREDVGRHNATDKVVGALLRAGDPVPPVLFVSGRVGFEIAQKAARLGVAVLAAISAPTSLAVELADAAGVALVGFLRGETYNVYTHAERLSGL